MKQQTFDEERAKFSLVCGLYNSGYSQKGVFQVLKLYSSEREAYVQNEIETICKIEGHWFDESHENCARCGFSKARMEA